MLILISVCLFLLCTFYLLFKMVNFTAMVHLNHCKHCQSAARAGCTLEDRELENPGWPKGIQCPHWQTLSLTVWPQWTEPGGPSTASGTVRDLLGPGSIRLQETRTGLETWLQLWSNICPGERDRVGLKPGTLTVPMGQGLRAQAELKWGSSVHVQGSKQASGDAGQG